MTKQHYAKIAAVIADCKDLTWETQADMRRYIAICLATALRGTNPNYDEARFLAACEVDDES